MSDELKPCPFCGDVAPEPMERAMRCRACWAVGPPQIHTFDGSEPPTREQMWNWRRAEDGSLYEKLKKERNE